MNDLDGLLEEHSSIYIPVRDPVIRRHLMMGNPPGICEDLRFEIEAQQHRVGDHRTGARLLVGGELLLAIDALAADPARVQTDGSAGRRHFLRGVDRRHEHHRFLASGVELDRAGDLREERLDGVGHLVGREVAAALVDAAQVDVERHRLHHRPHQPTIAAGVEHAVLVGDVFEEVAQRLLVGAVGRRGDAKNATVEVVQDLLVRGGERVVRLIDDDQREMPRVETLQPGVAAQGLDRSHHHLVPAAGVVVGLLLGRAHPGDGRELRPCLLDQLVGVGEDQHLAAILRLDAGQLGEHDGLAAVVGDGEIPQKEPPVALDAEPVEVVFRQQFHSKPSAQHILLLASRLGLLSWNPSRDLVDRTGNADAIVGASMSVLIALLTRR